jgi:hypothetical protein
MSSIYIAGPMSGYPEFNFPAFFAAEEEIRDWHHFSKIWNPAAKDQEEILDPEACKTGDHLLVQEKGFNFKEAYLWDITKVIESEAIYMLKGWQYSPGAVGEHAVAVAMKKHNPAYQIFYQESVG